MRGHRPPSRRAVAVPDMAGDIRFLVSTPPAVPQLAVISSSGEKGGGSSEGFGSIEVRDRLQPHGRSLHC